MYLHAGESHWEFGRSDGQQVARDWIEPSQASGIPPTADVYVEFYTYGTSIHKQRFCPHLTVAMPTCLHEIDVVF